MGNYAQVDDIKKTVSLEILQQLTDDEKNGQINEAIIEAAITQAEGTVNTALSEAGVTVPLSSVPAGAEFISTATIWLAVCKLAARRGVIPEDYRMWCEYYTRKLDDMARGDFTPPVVAGTTNNPTSSTRDQEKVFTRSKFDHDGNRLNPDERGSLDVV
jgi:phage gp36-like protein